MRRLFRTLAVLVVAATSVTAVLDGAPSGNLAFYFIDVEGGQSTLIVTPAGESLLVDSGYAANGRDSGRILAVMKDAGVSRIDHFLLTHFHTDHMGGVTELIGKVRIGTIYDHGALNGNEGGVADPAGTVAQFNTYEQLRAGQRHVEPRVGDRLRLKGVDDVIWVSSDRRVLKTAVSGGGARNPACLNEPPPAQNAENPRSTGFYLRFGKFRFVDLGDLSDQPLFAVVCPNALLGPVDLFLVPHHGGVDATYPAVLAAFSPRVAVVNNGPIKGGDAAAFDTLRAAPTLQDVWQLHRAEAPNVENYPDAHIANLNASTDHWIKAVAERDGTFSVTNGRTSGTRTYRSH
jgi:beta-lactamase superfamily II metal-dependent hydrolase